MPSTKRLTSEERAFFGLVARAALTNPFGPERTELDEKIGGARPGTPHEEVMREVASAVKSKIRRLCRDNRSDPNVLGKGDAELLRAAYLFQVFHQHLDSFDRLIEAQIEAGEKSCPVPFGRRVIEDLRERWFSEADAVKYLALFYQLRRAYYLVYRSLIGRSPSMTRLRLQLWQNVFTQDVRWYDRYLSGRMELFSTLLLGETGTGKGAAAAAIGKSGYIPFDEAKSRFAISFTQTYTPVNLSQYSEALLESELFGHRKGAFTGAIDHHVGILEQCSPHGAIFLDEIGDASTQAQIKLLKVLEDRVFSPVGGRERVRFEGRIIAATHRDLNRMRREETFRDDFYYRLCSDTIEVPPLRRRIQEDPRELDDMVTHLMNRLVGGEAPELVSVVRTALAERPGPGYEWPGNVRELEQAIRRVLLNRVHDGDHRAAAAESRDALAAGIGQGTLTAQELLRHYCALLYDRHRSYVDVARITGLDRRTVKKHVLGEDAAG